MMRIQVSVFVLYLVTIPARETAAVWINASGLSPYVSMDCFNLNNRAGSRGPTHTIQEDDWPKGTNADRRRASGGAKPQLAEFDP